MEVAEEVGNSSSDLGAELDEPCVGGPPSEVTVGSILQENKYTSHHYYKFRHFSRCSNEFQVICQRKCVVPPRFFGTSIINDMNTQWCTFTFVYIT